MMKCCHDFTKWRESLGFVASSICNSSREKRYFAGNCFVDKRTLRVLQESIIRYCDFDRIAYLQPSRCLSGLLGRLGRRAFFYGGAALASILVASCLPHVEQPVAPPTADAVD